jgi:hypothetical protein
MTGLYMYPFSFKLLILISAILQYITNASNIIEPTGVVQYTHIDRSSSTRQASYPSKFTLEKARPAWRLVNLIEGPDRCMRTNMQAS